LGFAVDYPITYSRMLGSLGKSLSHFKKGFTMAKKKKATTKKKTATKKAGKGKKICPKCQKAIGVRTAQCACGHTFPKTKTKKKGSRTKGLHAILEAKRAELQEQIDAINTVLGSPF
jgi:hypothetical protein